MPALPPYIIEPIFEQFLALLPPREVHHPLGCHRSRIPDRVVFEKLVQVLVFGCAYPRIADEECSATTLRRRRDEWIQAGVMEAMEEMTREAYDRAIGLELTDVAVDCCVTKAPCGGEKAGKSPVDRGKRGLKRSTMVDAQGIPLGVVAAPANCHDSPLLAPTLEAAEVSVGLPEQASVHLAIAPTTRSPRESFWSTVGWRAQSPRKANRLPSKPRNGGWWNGPTRGAMPTKSWCGVPRGKGGSSTSGSLFPTWSSSSGGSFERRGPATAGKAVPIAVRDLLAQPLRTDLVIDVLQWRSGAESRLRS